MTDNHQPLRDALKAGPTDGPWLVAEGRAMRVHSESDETITSTGCADSLRRQWEANAAYIAAANPAAISALLAERDTLAAEVEALTKENDSLRSAAAEKLMGETMLTDLSVRNGSLNAQIEGGAAGLLAQSFAEQFKDSGATNYLEVSFHHKDVGGLTVTLQRNSGQTPHMLRAKAEAQVEALRAALMAHEAAKDQLFAHCLSNGVFNAWGVAMDCTALNDASQLACAALQGESK